MAGVPGGTTSALPGGAALVDGSRGWVLIDDDRVAAFGAAMVWAQAHGLTELNVLAGAMIAGVLARRASQFRVPPEVWAVEGRSLVLAEPSQSIGRMDGGPDPELVELLLRHGATPVYEHGLLRGEVLGLEVARAVDGHLEVGVGRHDRYARTEMRPGQPSGDALDETVAAVRARRRAGAAPHPANTLARSRWLREVVCADPASVGAARLDRIEPPLPWVDLPEAGAAPCAGRSPRDEPLIVVCSVGVDPDLIPTAADARLLHNPEAVLWLVVPEGDDLPITRSLAAALQRPATVITVSRDWAALPASGPSTNT